ncbi:G2/mitotic-specific cyclin-B1 [Caenorhabditis elegans]|uniref:G2/mitotic-specific cyclin-B1 n=1 Tax=Caenorhabditis elegans TaxID=6239 RepID=CCNB1_CAEEL|nr:G2/mitotic-specific cyclin-B1 [Caenorhabditis elegans]Q10653.1 RecName: Full=G2/mitotic-specific cyclin-B1 [Caenorhabditis elegans]AAA84394.1 cyclin B [Caenorhabditis elegans]CAA94384.1 G2/mitotic-specific cyclin-B1 [Caenorhabditis elegans]|eukprot:NP_501987.1 G2/mitotic-specific cyclin-B1 [Caenorhabditis elegans]
MLRATNNRRTSNNVEKDSLQMAKHGNGPLKPVNAQGLQTKREAREILALKPSNPAPVETAQKSQRINLQDAETKCLAMADDIYKYLVHHEKKYLLEECFMEGGEPTPKMRRILVDWLVQVHVRFHLTPETLHLTVFILDRMLQKKVTSKADLQLLGISAMFVASKFEEVYLPDIHDYEFITENTYSKKQILAMEQTILNSLNFDLSCPSSLVFLRCLSRILSENDASPIDNQAFCYTYNISKCLGELALLDSVMASTPRSHIASASMIIALEVHPVDGIEAENAVSVICKQLGASKKVIEDAVALLAEVSYKNFKQGKLVAIKNKYQSSKLAQVSNLMTDDVLEKINRMGQNAKVDASEME